MLEIIAGIGTVVKVYTVVDFYQYIKTVEYLICIAFFVGFPMFCRYLNKDTASQHQLS